MHDITSNDLEHAEPTRGVAKWLTDRIGNRKLVSDAPEFDQRWLDSLLGTLLLSPALMNSVRFRKPQWAGLLFAVLIGGTALASSTAAQMTANFDGDMSISQVNSTSGGVAGTDMGGMDSIAGMMRPDAAPPNGVVGGMHPREGVLMPLFSYMYMNMDGNRNGTSSFSKADVLSQYSVAPLGMEVDIVMFGLMYGITDEISVMAMLPYSWKSMDHETGMGQTFTTRAQGFGDLKVIGGYDVYKSQEQVVELSHGLSFPTGSIDERDTTPAGPDQLLPYPMQLGSGTYDLLSGLTYTGRNDDWSWGASLPPRSGWGKTMPATRLAMHIPHRSGEPGGGTIGSARS